MAHKISIWKHLSECCYYEQESGFRVHLYELLKDPSRIEELVKDGYIILNRHLDRVDRAPEIDFLMALKVHFLDLENKRELYRTGDPDPYNLFLYHPGATPKLQSQSTIELRAVIDSHSICYEASRAYMDVIYCDTHHIGSQEKEFLIERYGKPSYIEESKGEQYCPGGYIVIPVDDVDKLIAIERFRELNDTDQEPIYTGEERIYELNLRSPDESIYKYFIERRIIVEYDPDNFDAKYLYAKRAEVVEPKKEPKKTLWFSSLFKKAPFVVWILFLLSSCLKETSVPISSSFELTIAEDKTSPLTVKLQNNSYEADEYE